MTDKQRDYVKTNPRGIWERICRANWCIFVDNTNFIFGGKETRGNSMKRLLKIGKTTILRSGKYESQGAYSKNIQKYTHKMP